MTDPRLSPFARLLAIEVAEDGPPLVLRMPYRPMLIGAPERLHGGAVAGLMELAASTALARALEESEAKFKPISVTADYLRAGAPADCFAEARIIRLGRRVAHIECHAWQSDRDRPIAAARMNLLIERR